MSLRFREIEQSDLSQINVWRNDPSIIASLGNNYRYLGISCDITWYQNYLANRNAAVRLTILADNVPIGLVNLTDIHTVNKSAELSIMIGDANFHRKGIGTLAVQHMIQHAFLDLNLNRLELSVLAHHKAAIHLYEKSGFRQEGLKKKCIFKNGLYEDLVVMALLRDDWKREN